MKDWSFVYIMALVIIEVYGDFALRFYAQTSELKYLAHGTFGYLLIIYFLVKALQLKNVMYVNRMWDGISCVVESIAAYYFLGETLNSCWEYIGFVMIIIGIYLLK